MKQMTCYAHPVPLLSNHNIVPTLPIPSCMVKTVKLRHLPMTVLSWTPLVRSAYTKLLEVSSIMSVPSTPPYWWHCPTLPRNNPPLLWTPRNGLTNSLTSCRHIPMPRFDTGHPTWYSMCTPTHHIYPPHVHAVKTVDISSLVASQLMVIQSN